MSEADILAQWWVERRADDDDAWWELVNEETVNRRVSPLDVPALVGLRA